MSDRLWLDRETWSEADLKVVGTYGYAETAQDLMIAYAIGEGPARVWDCTAEEMHDELWRALDDQDGEVWAHNAQFDAAVHNGPAQLHLPRVNPERWRCSMAMALSHALPAGLANLCEVLRVPSDLAKLADGKKLVSLFTKPQPANRKIQRATRLTHPAEWDRFKQYAGNDILAMRECVKRMPNWNWDSSAVAEWHLDQRMNVRGFRVDQDLTRAGAQAAVAEKERIATRFSELSHGEFTPSQRAKFQAYLSARLGVELDNTQSGTFKVMLRDPDLPADVREMMELSIAANKTSTAKYAALDPAVSKDGRFRGGLQFAGAGRTRRWAGRLFQPQNLPSRGLPKPHEIEQYIECLKQGTHTLFFDNLMLYGAAALRGTVIVPSGKKMVVADLSNIEGRVLAWLAQEKWKLAAFGDYDRGTGPDLYNITAVSIIGGDPWDVPKHLRNAFGKVPDLASGYQGGVAGYQTFARGLGIKMADFWDTIQQMIAPAHVQKAWANLSAWGHPQLESLEIDEIEWVASETCKLAWRARHPATRQFWYDLGNAAKSAIKNPNQIHQVGPFIKLRTVSHQGRKWLVVLLPSGRYLTYFEPHLVGSGRDETIAYWGESAEEGKTTRQWVRVFTHGGKMTGNCCQTIARDILAPALPVAEARGYLPILTVHDEILTEAPDTDEFSAAGLIEILATNPEWAPGLPLAAAGFETKRYFKD
ncbi:DNA polymerase I [Comamonas sp.]|uniref:DNA polymerase I n=1 Tax=Comamonas sp. TaxID=34028 RepID=UPI0028AAD16C|nr:DNA polymerase I [Comamonas sp.]